MALSFFFLLDYICFSYLFNASTILFCTYLLPNHVIFYIILKTFRHFKTQREKLCNDDVNRASVRQEIKGENQSKCENNLGYCIKLDRNKENMFSISFRKHRDEKKKNNLLALIIKM